MTSQKTTPEPIDVGAADRPGAKDTSEQAKYISEHSAVCACCRRPILAASNSLLAVHSKCWEHSGERIRRLSRAAIDRIEQAEISAWRDAYEAEEARLEAIEQKLQAQGYQTVRTPASDASAWR